MTTVSEDIISHQSHSGEWEEDARPKIYQKFFRCRSSSRGLNRRRDTYGQKLTYQKAFRARVFCIFDVLFFFWVSDARPHEEMVRLGLMRRRLGIPSFASAKQLASALKLPVTRVLRDLTVNARKRVFAKYGSVWHEFQAAGEVVVPFRVSAAYSAWLAGKGHLGPGFEVEVEEEDYSTVYDLYQASSDPAAPGIPVVVLLGHCDHGKTTLLEALSDQRHFLESEGADLMTQTVRTVYANVSPTHPITLVDTPGQDLFYRMRNYGAAVADAFLLVIAADEGVQQQTKESIGIIQGHLDKHSGAGALGRPTSRVIVAINKIDKLTPPLPPEASQEEILGHQQLRPLLEELRAYVALEGASLVGISALTGSNLEPLRRLLMLRQGAGDIECRSESEPSQEIGVGSILNIEQTTQTGIQLHVLLMQGSVASGAFFCAGGWSGTVRAIAAPHRASASTHAEEARFEPSSLSALVTAGMGAKLTVSLDSSSHEPLPLGNQILFLPSSRPLSAPTSTCVQAAATNVAAAATTAATPAFPLASLVGLPAREAAQSIAEQARMGHKLPLLRLDANVAATYRLPTPRFQEAGELENGGPGRQERPAAEGGGGGERDTQRDTKRDRETERQKAFEEREARREKRLTRREERREAHRQRGEEWLQGKTPVPTTVTEQEMDGEEEEEEEERENSDEDRQKTRRIVLKVDSHVTLETVMDAIDDAEQELQPQEQAQEQEQEQAEAEAPRDTDNVALKTEGGSENVLTNVGIIIRRGAGDVTATDALVARLSGAEIVMYNVKVLGGALSGASGKNVKTKAKSKGRSKGAPAPVPLHTFTRIPDIVDHIMGFCKLGKKVE
jgi:small GTP-binding protein